MLREQIPEQKENTKRADRWLYIAVVCLLVAVIVIAVLCCRSLIQEIGEDRTVTSTPTAWSMDVEPLSLEDLQEMSADELFDLFIRNGLVINERMANTLSEEVIKETLKSQIDILIEGITPCNDIMYWDFADSVKETYEKISGERE